MLRMELRQSFGGIFVNVIAILWLFIVSGPAARAVPSYLRQTRLACASCHYAPPEQNRLCCAGASKFSGK
jgi:hypothetical protein